MRCAILFKIIKSQQFSLYNKQMCQPLCKKRTDAFKIYPRAGTAYRVTRSALYLVCWRYIDYPHSNSEFNFLKKVFFYFSVVASQYSSSFMASTYWAMPSATSLAAFMASTTVWGRCTTSPPANTPRRVVIPMGRSPQIT